MEDIGMYSKDNEEIYIATSPSFSPIDSESIHSEEMYTESENGNSLVIEESCSTEFVQESERNIDLNTKDQSNEFPSLKLINPYPVVNTVDGQSYLVSSEFSQINDISQDNSKTFFYLLSPLSAVNTLVQTENEEILVSSSEKETLLPVSEGSKSLGNDEIIRTQPNSQNHIVVDNNEGHCLTELDQDTEHIDLVQTEISSAQNKTNIEDDNFDQLNANFHVSFINGIPERGNNQTKEEQQLVWHPLPVDVQEESKEDNTLLVKYDHNSKIELPISHGQPYLQVALVNDMDPSSTSEFVSTDQILGVALPEIFSCKWDGCGTHFLSKIDLVKHVNSSHVQPNSFMRFTCHWKGCVREGKQFDARYKLVIHLRTHTGEKPHYCSVEGCDASFSRIENLKIHIRTHTGERPYPCQYEGCDKSFANSSDRFKHKRTHTEKKPYRCPIKGCEKSYTDPSSLRKHRKRHLSMEGKGVI